MLQQFKKDFFLYRREILLQIIVQFVAFLFGIGLVLFFMFGDADLDLCLGTILSGIFLMFLTYYLPSISYSQAFMLALSMGRTRKSFMAAYYLRAVLQMLLGWAILLLLYRTECSIYEQRFPQYGSGAPLTFLTDWRIVLSVILLYPILPMCMGTLYGRYGRKGFAAFYLVWLFLCFIVPRMFTSEQSNNIWDQIATSLLHFIQFFPPTLLLLFGAVVFAGMLVVTIKFGMKLMVK